MNGLRLRELRAGRKISLEKLGEVINKSKISYSKKERGEVDFLPDEVLALSEFYELTYDEMNAIFYDHNLPNGKMENFKDILAAIGLL